MGSGHFDFNLIFSAMLAVVIAPAFSWFFLKGLRSGQTGPQKLPSSRKANPTLFWTYLAAYAAVATMCVAFAVFTTAYDGNRDSETTMISLLVAIFSFGASFAAMAVIIGFYTIQGFRSGTSVVFARGGPFFSDRVGKPMSYWSDQVFNSLITIFLGTIGLGGIAVCIWFVLGSLAHW